MPRQSRPLAEPGQELVEAKSPSTTASAPPRAEEPEPTSSTPGLGERIIAQARSAMSRYFAYPPLARRQGWEGEVLLAFSVLPDGRIDRVEVVHSSGHRLLDEAARTSLARVGSLPDEQPHGMLRLTLPVIYRLTEG